MSTATKTAQKWIVLGDATDRQGRVHDVGWPIQDMYTHGSIYGTTGSGKTTLMNNLIQQLIMSGCITLVVTPHADMIFDSKDGLLARMAPKYLHRVILLDPSQPYLPQLSLVPAGLSPSKTTETLLARIRSMEPSSWEDNTMMRQVLTHAVRALVAADGTTMMSTIDRFLKDDAFRDAITNRIPDMARETREFWEDVAEKLAEAKTDNTRARYFDPAQRRIDGFMTNDPLKWSLALPPMHPQATVNLHEQLQQAGPLLILVPLLEHKIGPVAMRMLGNLIVDLTVSACISRPPEKRVPTLLFIDELPNVIGTANIGHLLARIFAEFRKFALGTFVAFQSPDQLPSKLRKDIESLANTKIVMKVKSSADRKAAVEALGHPQIRDRDIQQIPKFGGYALTMIDRDEQPAYRFNGKLPLDYAHLTSNAKVPTPPKIDPETLQALKDLRKMSDDEKRVQWLHKLTNARFDLLVNAQYQVNQHVARLLYYQANREADYAKRVQLATELANKRNGFHWTWYEAWYRRNRYGRKGGHLPATPSRGSEHDKRSGVRKAQGL